MKTSLNITPWIDAAFCLVLLPSLIMLLPIDKWWEYRENFTFIMISWLYVVYVLQRSTVVPMFMRGKKNIALALLLFAVILIITHIITEVKFDRQPLMDAFMRRSRTAPPKIGMHQQATWFLFVIVSTFGAAVALFSQLHKQITLRQQIEFEKKRAELALYKAQINPHFLFNTLNTLYAMVVTKAERTEEVFILFTSLMKYIYSNSEAQNIALSSELKHINEYIELQKLRLGNNTQVETIARGAIENYSIAPMLLITFIENAFKYGVSSHTPSLIKIEVSMQDGELSLKTYNQIITRSETGKSGIGIENCRKRLELLYPKAYSLTVRDTGSEYFVELKIKLQ